MGDSNKASESVKKRQLRDRKYRKLYSDEWALADDELDGHHTFDLVDKLESDRFSQKYVKEMNGADVTVEYLQQWGFKTPILVKEKSGLGLQVPAENFSVNDVRMCVGSRRTLDVMDVNTQKNFEMSMRDWQRYYEDPNRDRLLNVISLEFSHTKLEHYVQAPSIVKQIDWVNCAWPQYLKECQTVSTNLIEEMMYPKVQKYCLMSVKDCFTDFHIDFGGTSVWYHILKGSKIFWLIPPTEKNVEEYERWVLSGKQGDTFFGDTVESCGRILLTAGNTFFIPTGWIHAVYTPEDSLVFGGNFLHSYGIDKQLRIAQVEDTTRVPKKFRYPFFTEMLWYVLEKYVHRFYGVSHLDESFEAGEILNKYAHLTPWELKGMKAIIFFLHDLPINKKNIPKWITDPRSLVKNVRKLLEEHRNDDPLCAVTGEPILIAAPEKPKMPLLPLERPYNDPSSAKKSFKRSAKKKTFKRRQYNRTGKYAKTGICERTVIPPKTEITQKTKRMKTQRRRTRCRECTACQRTDCGDCVYCSDMIKFGGSGKAKQTCMLRNCLYPILPTCAICMYCKKDGWKQVPKPPLVKKASEEESSLMECHICYKIAHPECMEERYPGIQGIPNYDLPNSWQCPKCCQDLSIEPQHFKTRSKTALSRVSAGSDFSSIKQKLKDEINYVSDDESPYSPEDDSMQQDDYDDDDDDDEDYQYESSDGPHSAMLRHSSDTNSFKRSRSSSEEMADLYGKRERPSECAGDQQNSVCIDLV